MSTISDSLTEALALHQSGRLDEAERVYRRVLEANPKHAGAMHLVGLLAFQRGDCQAALRQISEAIRLDGAQAAFHANLGEVFRALGRLTEARACYEQALRIKPDLPEANNNLGTLLQAERRLDEAIGCYRRAIAARSDYVDAHNNLGTALADQGQWNEAVDCYRRAVSLEPGYARGLYNLGVAYQATGQLAEAVQWLERATQAGSNYPEAHHGLGMVLQRSRRWTEAEAAYRRALQLRPASAEVLSSLGSLYQAQGKLTEAIARYEQATASRPGHAEAHYNWGTALVAQKKPDLAVEKYRRAIELKPDFADAHYNLGTVLQELGQLDAAASAYQRAIDLRPDMALAHNNLGNIYEQQDKLSQAIACYRRALACDPRHGQSLNNLGTVLQAEGRWDETLQSFRQAIDISPECAEAYCNLGTALHMRGDAGQALECFARSLELRPDSPEAHYNRALVHLSHERFEEGWQDFAWRLKCKKYPVRRFDEPLWDGQPFPGRALLVHAEQGFGDTLHFVRYLSLVRRLGGTAQFEIQSALAPLLTCSGFEGLVWQESQRRPFDLYAPLLSLPGLMHTNLDTIPRDVPYLAADSRLIESWRQRLSRHDGLKVGIAWQGNRSYAYDRYRSIPLAEFAPLAQVEGVTLLSLQKGDGTEQLASLPATWRVHDLGPELDESSGAFMDTAAVMKNLDLVVTSDTATAHLAGALGVRVWMALSAAPEWRWFLNREDSPWYPTMRLFRQTTRGDWSGVFARMAQELGRLVAEKQSE